MFKVYVLSCDPATRATVIAQLVNLAAPTIPVSVTDAASSTVAELPGPDANYAFAVAEADIERDAAVVSFGSPTSLPLDVFQRFTKMLLEDDVESELAMDYLLENRNLLGGTGGRLDDMIMVYVERHYPEIWKAVGPLNERYIRFVLGGFVVY